MATEHRLPRGQEGYILYSPAVEEAYGLVAKMTKTLGALAMKLKEVAKSLLNPYRPGVEEKVVMEVRGRSAVHMVSQPPSLIHAWAAASFADERWTKGGVHGQHADSSEDRAQLQTAPVKGRTALACR